MSKVTHTVSVDGGKYKFIARLGYEIDVDRHGEAWVTGLDAPKAVMSLMAELDAARVVVAAVRLSADVPHGIIEALERHDRLCDDREPPSAWCGSGTEDEPKADPVGHISNFRISEIGRSAALAARDSSAMTPVNTMDLILVVGELQRRRAHAIAGFALADAMESEKVTP